MFSGKKFLGVTLGVFASLLWASFYIVSRFVFGENEDIVDPVFFSFLRFALASIFFFLMIVCTGKLKPTVSAAKTDWRIFLMLGLIGIVGEGILVFWAMKYTTAARCSLFANASPIFTVIIAAVALNEKITRRKVLGMIVGFAATAIAITSRNGSDVFMSTSSVAGDLLALASGIFWAIYTVWGMGVSKKYGGTISTAIVIIIGTGMLFLMVIITGRPMVWDFPLRLWLATAYLGIFSSGIAYLCWYSAMKYLKAGELGAFGYVSATLTIMMAVVILHETITMKFIFALLGVFAGVYLMMEQHASPKKK